MQAKPYKTALHFLADLRGKQVTFAMGDVSFNGRFIDYSEDYYFVEDNEGEGVLLNRRAVDALAETPKDKE